MILVSLAQLVGVRALVRPNAGLRLITPVHVIHPLIFQVSIARCLRIGLKHVVLIGLARELVVLQRPSWLLIRQSLQKLCARLLGGTIESDCADIREPVLI